MALLLPYAHLGSPTATQVRSPIDRSIIFNSQISAWKWVERNPYLGLFSDLAPGLITEISNFYFKHISEKETPKYIDIIGLYKVTGKDHILAKLLTFFPLSFS